MIMSNEKHNNYDTKKACGKLIGVGVGPGDPELLTLKAIKTIERSSVIALPGENPQNSVAYNIVLPVCPDLANKELLALPMPMTKDPQVLEENHRLGAEKVIEYLEKGLDVAFLTLGDPTVYSTYMYVHKLVKEAGYQTEIISGITSFCAVAARLNISLVEQAEPLHILPASYPIEESLNLAGTKVLMKAGRKMKDAKELLVSRGENAVMIENCGMENEKIYYKPEEIPDDSSYYSLIVVKDSKL